MGEYVPRLRKLYRETIAPQLRKDFELGNVMQTPRLTKVSVNMGLGEAVQNPKLIEQAVTELAQLTGQKPIVTRAKKSIAGFKLREGQPIGVAVTLRRDRMYEFVDRLFNLALPRVRDFRGCSPKSFDGRGNYTMGVREQIVFPEIDYDKVEKIKGLAVTFTTTAPTDDQGRALLTALGLPFRK
ncbi:MAG: 50S ribosomal protein L5 [Myxococcales bacterium]|nr:50S ribosomal protein L5 [Myxococcales bacterium]MDD9966089.1 50S ribosomal protein L5 [Myxococcales bacterium]